ncbi:hypothetical protein ES705_42462 [subsurface metagenome]
MNVIRGKFNRRKMAGFAGIETLSIIDSRLAEESEKGYLKTEKLKGGNYQYILYPKPTKEIYLNNGTG